MSSRYEMPSFTANSLIENVSELEEGDRVKIFTGIGKRVYGTVLYIWDVTDEDVDEDDDEYDDFEAFTNIDIELDRPLPYDVKWYDSNEAIRQLEESGTIVPKIKHTEIIHIMYNENFIEFYSTNNSFDLDEDLLEISSIQLIPPLRRRVHIHRGGKSTQNKKSSNKKGKTKKRNK